MCFALHKGALLLGYILRDGISGFKVYVNSACVQNTVVFSKEVVPVYIHTGSAVPDLILLNSWYFRLFNGWVYSRISA